MEKYWQNSCRSCIGSSFEFLILLSKNVADSRNTTGVAHPPLTWLQRRAHQLLVRHAVDLPVEQRHVDLLEVCVLLRQVLHPDLVLQHRPQLEWLSPVVHGFLDGFGALEVHDLEDDVVLCDVALDGDLEALVVLEGEVVEGRAVVDGVEGAVVVLAEEVERPLDVVEYLLVL